MKSSEPADDFGLFVTMICGPSDQPAFRTLGSDLDYRDKQRSGRAQQPGKSPYRTMNRSFRGRGAWPRLVALNEAGAAVFMTINGDDGGTPGNKPITTARINRVRAVFVDLDIDGATKLRLVEACELAPHLIVNTSSGRFQAYWLTDSVELDEFEGLQVAIAARFGGDATVKDLPRIMRVPGFLHNKSEPPHPVRIISANNELPLHSGAALREAFIPYLPKDEPRVSGRRLPFASKALAPIQVGERNERLFDMARGFVNKGLSESAINARLQKVNATGLDEPLDAFEVDDIVRKAVAAPSVGRLSLPHAVMDAPAFHRLSPGALYLLLMAWRRAPEQRSEPFALPIADFAIKFGQNNKGFYAARQELVRLGFVLEHGKHAIDRAPGVRGRDASLYRLGIGIECISYTQIEGDLSVDPTQVESISPPGRHRGKRGEGHSDAVIGGIDIEALALRDGLDAYGEGAYGE